MATNKLTLTLVRAFRISFPAVLYLRRKVEIYSLQTLFITYSKNLPHPGNIPEKVIKQSTLPSFYPDHKLGNRSAASKHVSLYGAGVENESAAASMSHCPIDLCIRTDSSLKIKNVASLLNAYTFKEEWYNSTTTDSFRRKSMLFP